MTIAFLYKWTQKSTGMWYVGSRTAKGCHPTDGYICSSKYVKPMILENEDDWFREVLMLGEPKFIRYMESRFLGYLAAKDDPNSYNKDNADGNFTSLGNTNCGAPKGTIPWNKGLSTKDGSMTPRSKNRSERKDKGSIKMNQRGPSKNAYYGYYVDSLGNRFVSAIEAGKCYGVSHTTILRWVKINKNNWQFILRNLSVPE
jgi:hypothetical protein